MSYIGNEEMDIVQPPTFDADLATTSASFNPIVDAPAPHDLAPTVSPLVNFNILDDLHCID